MSIPDFFKLNFIISKRNKKLSPSTYGEILQDIHRLNSCFASFTSNVYLVGGIGMAIRKNRFYRNHRDLDIAIFTEDIEQFFSIMKAHGYRILNKHVSGHISPNHNLQVCSEVTIDELMNTHPDQLKIRLLKDQRHFSTVSHRSEFFDVFLLGKTARGVLLHGYDSITPWRDFNPFQPVFAGSNVLLPNLNYKRYLKPQNNREIWDFQMADLSSA